MKYLLGISLLFYLTTVVYSQPKNEPALFSSPIDSMIDNQSSTISIGLGNGTYSVLSDKAYNNWDLAVNINIKLAKFIYLNTGLDAYEGYSHQKITMFYIGPMFKHSVFEKKRNAVSLKLGFLGVILGQANEFPLIGGDFNFTPSYDYWITRNFSINAELRSHIIIHQKINYIFNPVIGFSLHLL
ncbi:MAG: hypothetical protein EHM58_01700 [Ignavibacteriae bacterium]|nr:MAG: hypothetical protein EHM58_01700 [Ignavibacteriota bacterium]